jgi:hypothetical protein
VIVSDVPDDGGDDVKSDLIEDETPRDDPEEEESEPVHGRWPDQDEPVSYVDVRGETLDRFCTCSWAAFRASRSLEVECSKCKYWYHSKCTHDLYRSSTAHIESVVWVCDRCQQ